jgi:hypothetical protein
MSPTRAARSVRSILVVFALATACARATAPPSDPTPAAPSNTDDVAGFSFAFTMTPPDVLCARGTVTTANEDKVVRTFDVAATSFANFIFSGVPIGRIRLFVEAFNVSCANLQATTPATWVADKPTEVDLAAAANVSVPVTLRRAAKVGAAVDFQDANPSVTFGVSSFEFPPVLEQNQLEVFVATLINASPTTSFTPNLVLRGGGASQFGLGNTCLAGENCCATGKPVPALTTCVLRLVFKPTSPFEWQATLDAGGNVLLPVKGSGTMIDGVSLVPSTLELGAVAELDDRLHSFTLINGSARPFPPAAFLSSGDGFFVTGGSCAGLTKLDPGAECSIVVLFAPRGVGSRSAVLRAGSPTSNLTARIRAQVVGEPNVTVVPQVHDFGKVAVGDVGVKTFSLFNPRATAVGVSAFIIGPNLGELRVDATTCSTVLPSGASCSATIAFAPTSAGAKTATFSFNPAPGPIPLQGTAIDVALSPSTFDFGQVAVGQSADTTITVDNPTANALAISPSVGGNNPGEFARAGGTCGPSVPARGSCTLVYRFSPAFTGAKSILLVVAPDPRLGAVSLTGTGISAGTVTPTSANYGNVAVGKTNDATFTVANGSASALALSVSVGGVDPGEFSRQGGTCGGSLLPGATCTVVIRFAPTSPGAKSALFSAGNGISGASLSGTGIGSVTLTPATVAFGSVIVGQSTSLPLTIANTTSSAFAVGVSLGGASPGEFSRSGGTCGSNLPGQSSCTIVMRFAPTSAGVKSSTLVVGAGANGAALEGTGVASGPSITNLIVNDTATTNPPAGMDGIANSLQWSVQPSFGVNVTAFGDRSVTIKSSNNGTLDGKPWIRTAADSKNFKSADPNAALATFTATGQFVNLLVDDRWNGGAGKPSFIGMGFTKMTFNVLVAEGTKTWTYNVWRRPITSGETVSLPVLGDTTAPCYIVVLE